MASLHTLPAPLPLYISKQFSDLKSLDALRCSCSLFAALFAEHAVELLEHLMHESLHREVVVELRAHILLLAARSRWIHTEHPMRCLHEEAKATLSKHVPIQAISLGLRTVSFVITLSDQVAARRLKQLYALPYQRPRKRPIKRADFDTIEGVAYSVPEPSPLYWVEQQRMLQGLLYLRSYGLLRLGSRVTIDSDGREVGFAVPYECQHMFKDSLQLVMDSDIPQELDWAAPVASIVSSDDRRGRWESAESTKALSTPSNAWQTFNYRCLISLATPWTQGHWSAFAEFGLGIWSDRRTALDLQLIDPPRWREDLQQDGGYRMFNRHDLSFTWWRLYRAIQKACEASL